MDAQEPVEIPPEKWNRKRANLETRFCTLLHIYFKCFHPVHEIVIKSLLCTHSAFKKGFEEQVKKHLVIPIKAAKVNSRYNCYMLLGYDIILDQRLKAHLLGMNPQAHLTGAQR